MWSEFPIIQHSESRGQQLCLNRHLFSRYFSWPCVGLDPEKSLMLVTVAPIHPIQGACCRSSSKTVT